MEVRRLPRGTSLEPRERFGDGLEKRDGDKAAETPDEAAAEDPAVVEAAWAAEIEKRARRVLAGETAGTPWEDVRRRAEAELRRR